MMNLRLSFVKQRRVINIFVNNFQLNFIYIDILFLFKLLFCPWAIFADTKNSAITVESYHLWKEIKKNILISTLEYL